MYASLFETRSRSTPSPHLAFPQQQTDVDSQKVAVVYVLAASPMPTILLFCFTSTESTTQEGENHSAADPQQLEQRVHASSRHAYTTQLLP